MTGSAPGEIAAAARVSADVRHFISHVGAERRRLYRAHLQTAVTRVSPLVLDLAVHGGSRLVDLAWEFEPPTGWPWYTRAAAKRPLDPAATAGYVARLTKGRDTRRRRRGATRRGGMVTCTVPGRADEIGFVVIGGHVDVVAALGGVTLQTSGGLASIAIPEPLPEILAASLPGRRLDGLIRHPAIDGRGYVIEDVGAFRNGGGSVVSFRTGLLPFEMPWGDPLGQPG